MRVQRQEQPLYVAFLNAKAALDVVLHSLVGKLFQIGVEGVSWSHMDTLA